VSPLPVPSRSHSLPPYSTGLSVASLQVPDVPNGRKMLTNPILGDPQAFCLGDVRVSTHIGARYTGAACYPPGAMYPGSAIYKCWITFRTQKNGTNGEEKLFTCNKNPDGREFVRPMYRIIQRFVQLRGPHDNVTPLAI
jgi:hypothetical protein